MGTAKMCTSQHIEISQFTVSSRAMPGAASRSQARRWAWAAVAGRGMGATRGTWRTHSRLSSGSASSSP